MKLSIAMATYNGEKFIKEQLDSILNQTRLPDEIVISDDASTDKTVEILMEYKEKYPKFIKLILNKENVGFVKNFERAIMNTTGDLVALSDQDDVWLPTKLEKECKVLEENQDVGMVFCDLKVVDEKLNTIYNSFWKDKFWKNKSWNMKGTLKGTSFFQKIFIEGNRVTGCTITIRKEILGKTLPFNDGIQFHDYWIALVASTLSDVFAIDETLILYRQHGKNQIGALSKSKMKTNKAIIVQSLEKEYESLNLLSELLSEYIKSNCSISFQKKVKKHKLFLKSRLKLYLSANFLDRVRVFLFLAFKMNLYPKKIGFFKDFIFTISPKIAFTIENAIFSKKEA